MKAIFNNANNNNHIPAEIKNVGVDFLTQQSIVLNLELRYLSFFERHAKLTFVTRLKV